MNDLSKQIAELCLCGAQDGSMTFPQIVGKLIEGGFESYTIDYRRSRAIYYRPNGDSVELTMHRHTVTIAETFDTDAIKVAIKEAQKLVPGYTYEDFCKKVMSAGCVGYIVSFSGQRALYFGRTAETHVEHFPQ